MKIQEMIKAMKVSISEVLEQMFFLPIDKIEEINGAQAWADDQKYLAASVCFEGASSGIFMLTIPSEMAISITADFLGVIPEALSEEQVGGTVKEMINMLAGNSLSCYDADTSFELKIPELHKARKEKTGFIDFSIETLDGLMTLQMAVQ